MTQATSTAERIVGPPVTRQVLADDAETFMLAVPGASGGMVRTGRGSGSSTVTSHQLGAVQLATLEFGFPMVGEAHADLDTLVLATVLRVSGEGRWDGHDLSRGQTFAYGPGSVQLADDPDGLVLGLTTIPWDVVESAADSLDLVLGHSFGQALLADAPWTRAMTALYRPSAEEGVANPLLGDRVLETAVRALCMPDVRHDVGLGRGRGLRDRDVVEATLAHLDQLGVWSAPILSICAGIGVSERRVQIAFRNTLGIGPNAYLRHRALEAVRQTLLRGDPAATNVSAVAADHGFFHGGRFSVYYNRTFGELPSVTLRHGGRSSAGPWDPRVGHTPTSGRRPR